MIDYSVSARINPQDREAAPRFYASAQLTKVMDLEEFAKHIATHGNVYKRYDIRAVLTMAVDCLREMLLNGYKVQLGDLGSFYPSFSSRSTLTAKDFNPVLHIASVNVNWECGDMFYDIKEDAEFNLVTTRAIQRTVLKAVKNGETVIDLNTEPAEEENTDEGEQEGEF